MKYTRKLRQSEVERYFIYISSSGRSMFPKQHEQFKVMVNGKSFNVEIDSHWRIWANYFWRLLPSFKEDNTLIMEKNPDSSFNISVEPKGKQPIFDRKS
jgi:predicted transposase YbfD/YdcC